MLFEPIDEIQQLRSILDMLPHLVHRRLFVGGITEIRAFQRIQGLFQSLDERDIRIFTRLGVKPLMRMLQSAIFKQRVDGELERDFLIGTMSFMERNCERSCLEVDEAQWIFAFPPILLEPRMNDGLGGAGCDEMNLQRLAFFGRPWVTTLVQHGLDGREACRDEGIRHPNHILFKKLFGPSEAPNVEDQRLVCQRTPARLEAAFCSLHSKLTSFAMCAQSRLDATIGHIGRG